MKCLHSRGFTLIELLTVIAIISILAAMTAIGLPRVIERAKLADLRNTLNNLRLQLAQYSVDNKGSFPPAYGYQKWETRYEPKAELDMTSQNPEVNDFHLMPYLAYIGRFRVFDVYDEFAETGDTNRDRIIQLLEFSPLGRKTGPDSYEFPGPRYNGSNWPAQPQIDRENRPCVYMPVYSKDIERVRRYYYRMRETGNDQARLAAAYARMWDPADANLARIKFPPPKYDEYVLISVGPAGNAGGVVPALLGGQSPNDPDVYYITALRGHYLATRDINDNGMLDFHYENRMGKGEGKATAYTRDNVEYYVDNLYLLPDDVEQLIATGGAGSGPGPFIYAGQ